MRELSESISFSQRQTNKQPNQDQEEIAAAVALLLVTILTEYTVTEDDDDVESLSCIFLSTKTGSEELRRNIYLTNLTLLETSDL